MALHVYLKDHKKHNHKKGDIVKTMDPHYAKKFIEDGILSECDEKGNPVKPTKKEDK